MQMQIGQVLGKVTTPEFTPRGRFVNAAPQQPVEAPAQPAAEMAKQPVLATA
jgi:hypothetical protein